MSDLLDIMTDSVYERITAIIENAHVHVSRTVNTAMVHAYWWIGREIVEQEQRGQKRAGYGDRLIDVLSTRLTERFGRGFTSSSLKRMRQFYLAFPSGSALPESLGGPAKGAALRHLSDPPKKGAALRHLSDPPKKGAALRHLSDPPKKGAALRHLSNPPKKGAALRHLSDPPKKGAALRHLSDPPKKGAALRHAAITFPPLLFPPHLSWTHYRVLIGVEDPLARAFYEIEAAREGWPVRELERQIASLLFERLAKSRNKDQVLALATEGQQIASPLDVLKDPFVLEFLDLKQRPDWLERDLEQAIMDQLQEFLLELGKGFCFVARQRRITLDGDHFYIDLVFYNRLLKCFVLLDLKLGKLTHQDLGQMQMYVNFYDRYQREPEEAPTVGIVLCSEKNDTIVKITLPENNEQILAARYQLFLPSEEELRQELSRGRAQAEHVLRLGEQDKALDEPPARPSPEAVKVSSRRPLKSLGRAAPRRPSRRT